MFGDDSTTNDEGTFSNSNKQKKGIPGAFILINRVYPTFLQSDVSEDQKIFDIVNNILPKLHAQIETYQLDVNYIFEQIMSSLLFYSGSEPDTDLLMLKIGLYDAEVNEKYTFLRYAIDCSLKFNTGKEIIESLEPLISKLKKANTIKEYILLQSNESYVESDLSDEKDFVSLSKPIDPKLFLSNKNEEKSFTPPIQKEHSKPSANTYAKYAPHIEYIDKESAIRKQVKKYIDMNSVHTAYALVAREHGEKAAVKTFLDKYRSTVLSCLFSDNKKFLESLKILAESIGIIEALDLTSENLHLLKNAPSEISKESIWKILVDYSIKKSTEQKIFNELIEKKGLEFAVLTYYNQGYGPKVYRLLAGEDSDKIKTLRTIFGNRFYDILKYQFEDIGEVYDKLSSVFSKEDVYKLLSKYEKYGTVLMVAKHKNELIFLYDLLKSCGISPEVLSNLEENIAFENAEGLVNLIEKKGFNYVFWKVNNKHHNKISTTIEFFYDKGYKKDILNCLLDKFPDNKAYVEILKGLGDKKTADILYNKFGNIMGFEKLFALCNSYRDVYLLTFDILGEEETLNLANDRGELEIAYRELVRANLIGPKKEISSKILLQSGHFESYIFSLIHKPIDTIKCIGLEASLLLAKDIDDLETFLNKASGQNPFQFSSYVDKIIPKDMFLRLLIHNNFVFAAVKYLEKEKNSDIEIVDRMLKILNESTKPLDTEMSPNISKTGVWILYNGLIKIWGIERTIKAMEKYSNEVIDYISEDFVLPEAVKIFESSLGMDENANALQPKTLNKFLVLLNKVSNLDEYTEYCIKHDIIRQGFKVLYDIDETEGKNQTRKMLGNLGKHGVSREQTADLLLDIGLVKNAYDVLTSKSITYAIEHMEKTTSLIDILKITVSENKGVSIVINKLKEKNDHNEMYNAFVEMGDIGIETALKPNHNLSLGLYEYLCSNFGVDTAYEIFREKIGKDKTFQVAKITAYASDTLKHMWEYNRSETLNTLFENFGVRETVAYAWRVFTEDQKSEFLEAVLNQNDPNRTESILRELSYNKYFGIESLIDGIVSFGGSDYIKQNEGAHIFYDKLLNFYMNNAPQNLHKILLPLVPYDVAVKTILDKAESMSKPAVCKCAMKIVEDRMTTGQEYAKGLGIIIDKLGENNAFSLFSDINFWDKIEMFSKYKTFVEKHPFTKPLPENAVTNSVKINYSGR
ncbi:hypothetical protein KO465_05625 [Candidatus Micrarchaeota archaeon]|nr:hypothetical protein [Candidatus Micrarchaeota archaeon]